MLEVWICILSLLLSIVENEFVEIFTNWNWKSLHFEVWFSSHIDVVVVLLFDVQKWMVAIRFGRRGEERRGDTLLCM
jgi:hypothetical protein